MGNSADEMRDAFALLSQTAGKAESKNALSVLDTVLNQAASPASSASPAQEKNDAPYPPQAKVSAFPVGEPNDAFAKYFTGKSWFAFLSRVPVSKDGTLNLSIANVTFEPCCRNNWHIHRVDNGGGQILICVGGRGWYREEGRNAQALKPGDIVNDSRERKTLTRRSGGFLLRASGGRSSRNERRHRMARTRRGFRVRHITTSEKQKASPPASCGRGRLRILTRAHGIHGEVSRGNV